MSSRIYKSDSGQQAIETFYRNVLLKWPVANEQRIIPTCQGETFVLACGPADAPPVIPLHGSGTNSFVWFCDVVEWTKTNRVYAVDLIGEPGLSAPSRPPLRSDAFAAWLDDVWTGLGIAEASIVGVSLGGWVALDYAVRRPSRVTSLSLLSPAGIGARKGLFMLKAMLLLMLGKVGVSKALTAAAGKKPAPSSPVTQYMKLIFENFRPRGEAPPIIGDAELQALPMPVQVIVGANDAMLHAQQTRDRVSRLLPHAELAFLEDAGHMLPPQTARVAAFLSRVADVNTVSVA